jgi:hypothetical protein
MKRPDHDDGGNVAPPGVDVDVVPALSESHTACEPPPVDLSPLTPNESKFYNDFGTVSSFNATTVTVVVRMDSLTPAMMEVFGDQDSEAMYRTFPRHSIPSHLRSTRPHTVLVSDQTCLAAVWEGTILNVAHVKVLHDGRECIIDMRTVGFL